MSGHALHPEAYGDLDDIRGYIAQHDPDAADRVITEIFDAIRALAKSRYGLSQSSTDVATPA